MWENVVESDKQQMTIWRTRILCVITKATNTYSDYVILMVFHYYNGYKNAPQFYVIRNLPVMLFYVLLLHHSTRNIVIVRSGVANFLTPRDSNHHDPPPEGNREILKTAIIN